MNRSVSCFLGAFAAVLIAAAQTFCADLLLDDFTDMTASRQKWRNTLSQDMMTAVVSGGTVTINNASNYGAEYLHEFNSKPTVFTVSVVLKSSTDSRAGLYFCRADDNYNGYIVSIEDGYLLVLKYISGTGNSIYYKPSLDLNASDNKLTVSKSGSEFHLYVNDIFQGKFEDAQFNSGDVSLFVPRQSSAVFSEFRMTDEFTGGSPPTSFYDDFSGTALKKEWRFFGNDERPIPNNGALNAAVASGKDMHMYIDMELTDFSAGVDVRHIAGSASQLYGLVLIGKGEAGASVPMVYFWITGDQKYAVYNNMTDDINATITHSNVILGSAGALDVVWIDNLKIKKASGASTYEFTINGETVNSAHPTANFEIKGIGLICRGGQTIAFDNFYVEKEDSPTSVKWSSKQASRHPSSIINRNHAFYDLRGRKRCVAATSAQSRAQTTAAGIYVNKNGREAAVIKKKVISE